MRTIPRPFYLVGLPASGKSTVGAALARRLSWQFIELNAEIEKRYGPLLQIAEHPEGRHMLAHYERETIFSLRVPAVGRDPCRLVIAASSGCFADPQCQQLMHRHGTSVLLDVSPNELERRLKMDAGNGTVRRLAHEPSRVIQRYVASAIDTFRSAQMQVAVSEVAVEAIVDRILVRDEQLRQRAA